MSLKPKTNKINKLCRIFFFLGMFNASYAFGMVEEEEGEPKRHSCINCCVKEAEGTAPARAAAVVAVPRPVDNSVIPECAQRDKEAYLRFLGVTLVYRPTPESEEGKIVLPIADLQNPLQGEFNLFRCGVAAMYLTIGTGYFEGGDPANAGKLEIRLLPRFLITGSALEGPARHLGPIIERWRASPLDEVGLFWRRGGDGPDLYDHTTASPLGPLRASKLLAGTWKDPRSVRKARVVCYTQMIWTDPMLIAEHFSFEPRIMGPG